METVQLRRRRIMHGEWFNKRNGRPPVRIRIQRAFATWQSQSWRHRYLIAIVITAIAGGLVALVDFTLSFAPFALFVVAAALSWLYGRMGPALLSITLATLASDFLLVQPRYEFTLNHTTAGLGATYAAGALLSRIFVYWTVKRG
jgi:K+-sensing histidine kinase KdpD